MISKPVPCQYLEWDSDFFGVRIARITVNRLSDETARAIIEWGNSHQIDCIYFLCDIDDESTIRLAEDNRFSFVDVRMQLKKDLRGAMVQANGNTPYVVRLSTLDDVPFLRAIARVNYGGTRFYFDKNFPTSQCDALYETWIEKSCNGYDDVVFVAEVHDQPVGYISCKLLSDNEGQIGLFGIEKAWQGIGLGQQLVNESLRWFESLNVTQVIVVTQGRNYAAQRLYQRCGFLTVQVQLWYHKWFTPKATK